MKLPESFKNQIKDLIGEECGDLLLSLHKESPTSIRLNPLKNNENETFHQEEKVPWASNAYYLKDRPVFTLDPLFHAGAYYVQEASSMYLEQIVSKNISGPGRILDLCAAPGGKSTHLLSILPEDSLLVANEIISSRSKILSENITKWGNSNTIVLKNDPYALGQLSSYFDAIIADVPCSGEGMFRKDPTSISEWSVKNVHLCAERQRKIIGDIWPALKSEGILVYSTCTYNKEENENNIDWICRELDAEVIDGPHRFFPHKIKGEGFFIAAVKKNSNGNLFLKKNKTKQKVKIDKSNKEFKVPQEMRKWIHDPDHFSFLQNNRSVIAIPSVFREDFYKLLDRCTVIKAGVKLGEIKGKDMIPSHELAMSLSLSKSSFPVCLLNKENALRYLRKDNIDIPFSELATGYILISYNDFILGFIKNIGSRINNLYPNEWRIRMGINFPDPT